MLRFVQTAGVALVALAASGPAASRAPGPQDAPRTTRDGVFTAEDAQRGRSSYEQHCQECHGVDLSGGVGRRLIGDAFIADWSGLGLERLLDRVRTMPPAGPHLDEAEYLTVLAYILDRNGFPPGTAPLSVEVARAVSIAAHDDRDTPPESGLVQAVGCLTRNAGRQWMLTAAGEPVRTKDPSASPEAERQVLAQRAAGTRAYRLLNAYPAPDRFEQQRVEVKGLLIRGDADSLNVTSIAPVAGGCER